MNERARLERAFAGEPTDRLPAALWRHWPGDDQRTADFARSVVWFQQHFQWDFAVVAPSQHYSVVDYGLQDEWQGDPSGQRQAIRQPIARSLHWTELRPQDPNRGSLSKQAETLRLVRDALPDTPLLTVIYSPLAQAASLSGHERLLYHMRTHPDRLRSGLNTITESTLQYMDALRRSLRLDGIVYVADVADFSLISEVEYQSFGTPYDTKILDMIAGEWWINMIQVRGASPILHLFIQYPVQILSWADQRGQPSLERAYLEFSGAYYGGLGAREHLLLGTPAIIRDSARQAAESSPRSLILGTGEVLPVLTPLSNLHAVKEAAAQIHI